MSENCLNRLDSDDPESGPCGDEGSLCDSCLDEIGEHWAAHFGLRKGMTSQQRQTQLEQWRPFVSPEEAGE